MGRVTNYLLPVSERPEWLDYPPELADLITAGRVSLPPWHLCTAGVVRATHDRLKLRLGRDLIPFAYRQDREDLACFEKGKGREVQVIHDNTEPGWEDEGWHPDFVDWLREAEAEAAEWGDGE